MDIRDLLSDPVALAAIRRRACGDAGFPPAPPVQLRSIASKYPTPVAQRRSTSEAAAARSRGADVDQPKEGKP